MKEEPEFDRVALYAEMLGDGVGFLGFVSARHDYTTHSTSV